MTPPIVRRRASAIRDLDGAAAYIQARDGAERAIRFLRDAEATFDRLARGPLLGALHPSEDPSLAAVRVGILSRFRAYLVDYRPIDGGIEVIRVLHGARDVEAILSGEDLGGEPETGAAGDQPRGEGPPTG